MGSSASTRINEFQKIKADLKLTTLPDLDKVNSKLIPQLLIVAQDLLKVTEQLRSRIVSYHDLLMRAMKLQSYKDVTLIDAFKIWYLCTLVCNDTKGDNVQFECKIENFDHEVLPESLKKLMSFVLIFIYKQGSVVAFTIEEKFIQDEKEHLIICETGICGDFKLQLWPFICSSFLSYLRSAVRLAPFLEEKINSQINLIRKYIDVHKAEKLTKNINQQTLTHICEQFKYFGLLVDKYHQEVKVFTKGYKEIMKELHPLSQEVLREEGNQNYILNDERTILKTKIQSIIKKYLPNYVLKEVIEIRQEMQLKEQRRKVKPKTKLERRRTEQAALTFPTTYHWVGHEYFDTFFSAQSLTLSELEECRSQGEEARKKLFKITGVNQWKDNTIKSVFECLAWILSAELNKNLKDKDFKLLKDEPWLHFIKQKKHKFTELSSLIVANLKIWLKYFSPIRYERICNYYQDFLKRQKELEKNKFEFHHLIRDLPPQNQYNALSSFSKNIRVNETYMSKIEKLFEMTIQSNGKMGEELYENWQDIVNQADSINYQLGTPFNEFIKEFRPNTLAELDELQNRKAERKQTKLSIACIEV
ncbi:unnamed protein product (macronuclear) [Paramecium tetraurelia]|uniref:Uncharacterized protein n=1 Tax=Paramecium tetraurelia TaxID=5888 RepID=A0CC31_PARTE|nr:uncharacterized protein GSPATT00037132001 [Paramecium tetraurelia]CAK68348.1 unnamed protein product [Paramecium tetraurelia]|eukprot:XP_001435745.1 hypothetical protein (macronuclear) [Paramecium tetraurelia strain d4-2]